jgi:hypothetical protein
MPWSGQTLNIAWRQLRSLRIVRSKALFIVLTLLTITTASGLALRGYFAAAPTDQFQAFDITSSQLGTIYSFSIGDSISLPTNNFTILSNPQSQNTTVANDILSGSFSSTTPVAVVFQENTDVNAIKYPYFVVSVTTAPNYSSTSGFAFGLRFLVRLADGSVVQLSNDKLSIEHVRSGTTTTLRVYVLNYNPSVNRIIGIRFYAEERAGINSEYSIRINSIVASSLNQVPYCTSPVCYIPIELPNNTGYVDTLVTDVVFTGASSYNIALSYHGQMFVSRPYSNESSHVSLTASSQNTTLQSIIQASTPTLPTGLYVISNTAPTSIRLQNLKLTFTPVLVTALSPPVPWQTDLALLFVELLLVFAIPAELLILRAPWKICLVAGIIARVVIMPWTGHPSDTTLLVRTSYLWYHEGWGPIFYNPPTVFALSAPVGSMQFYYLLGLDRIDPTFLFHYGGVLATFFVKLPFLLADLTSAVILSRVSENKMYGMYYFLNPFSIYVSAVWGQYEGLTTLGLIVGYVAIVKLKPKLSTLVSFGGFLLAGLVELFGFFVIPLMAVYLGIKKRYVELVLPISATLIALLIPSSLSAYVFSFSASSPLFQSDIYSFSGNFGIISQLPLIGAVTASVILALYSLFRSSAFFSTLAPVSAAIISFQLFAFNHPQFTIIPIGLMTLLFAARNDADGLAFVWICGAVLAFISIVGTQSFAYLLTGQGYYLIPLIEGGQHLKFYALGLVTVNAGLLSRAYRRLPLVLTSLFIAALVGLGWYLVNFA